MGYVSVEMAAGYQQMIGVKPYTTIWFVCIDGSDGICNSSDINWSDIHTVCNCDLRSNGRMNLR